MISKDCGNLNKLRIKYQLYQRLIKIHSFKKNNNNKSMSQPQLFVANYVHIMCYFI